MPPTIVFFGDSLTEGRIGASYVERVQAGLAGQAHVINAGINGDTVLNLRRRIARDVAAHDPDLVVVLVGLNDLGTVYARHVQRVYYHLAKRNPLPLTPQRFGQGYRALVAELRVQTRARLVLCTPTTLGEHPGAPIQSLVEAYVAVVRTVAHQEGLALIDLRAAFVEALALDPRPGQPYHLLVAVRDMLAVRSGRTTYADLTARRGYRLLCDGVHLAEAGADLAAQVLLPEVRALLASSSQ
jgi:lysophospholipase L1-like esterase